MSKWIVLPILFVTVFGYSQNLISENAWLESYKRALRMSPSEACPVFTELANETSVGIHELAVVRREKACLSTDLSSLKSILQNSKKVWIHSQAREVAFSIAKRIASHETVMELAPELVKKHRSQKKREEIWKEAISSAKTLGDTQKEREFKKRLYKNSPRLHPNPPTSLLFAVASDYKSNREWQNAADAYRSLFTSSTSWSDKLKAIDGVRRSIKEKFRSGEGTVGEFLDASKEFGDYALAVYTNQARLNLNLKLEEKRELSLAWFQHGRDIWSYAKTGEEAKVGIRKVVDRWLKLESNPEFIVAHAYMLLARVSKNYSEDSRGMAEAEKSLAVLSRLGKPKNWVKWQKELYDSSLWLSAFLTRKTGDISASLAKMNRVANESQASWAKRRGLFWQGRTNKELGRMSRARKYYKSLIKKYPYHYYSYWARYDIGIKLAPLTPYSNTRPKRPAQVSQENDLLIRQLVAAGELKIAREFLNKYLSPRRTDLKSLLYRNFVGDNSTVLSAFFSMGGAQRRVIQDRYASIIFPKPHRQLVEEQAGRWESLDSHYVYSIMRQESGYDPFSLSWADARGLLQLVPRVAEVEQKRGGVTYTNVDELFLPEVNIPIGTAALDTRFGLSDNNFIITTGSYNAGEKRVHRWWKKLYRGKLFEFLEDIPTEETRTYIRLVTRNYLMNERLNASRKFSIPDRLFKLYKMPEAGAILVDESGRNGRDLYEPGIRE